MTGCSSVGTRLSRCPGSSVPTCPESGPWTALSACRRGRPGVLQPDVLVAQGEGYVEVGCAEGEQPLTAIAPYGVTITPTGPVR